MDEVKDGIQGLDEIEKDLTSAKKRRSDLKTELKSLNVDLTAKQRQQSDQIVDNKAVAKIGSEIVAIRIKIEGIQSAIKQLDDEIYNLEANKIIRLRKIASVQAKEHQIECLKMERAIYSLLAEAAGIVADLDREREQCSAALRSSGLEKGDVYNQTRKEHIVINEMKSVIPKLLQSFPNSIFAGDLPKPEKVKRAMTGKVKKPDALRHFWEQNFYDWARRNHAVALGKEPGQTQKKETEFNGHSGEFETCTHRACVMAREAEAGSISSS